MISPNILLLLISALGATNNLIQAADESVPQDPPQPPSVYVHFPYYTSLSPESLFGEDETVFHDDPATAAQESYIRGSFHEESDNFRFDWKGYPHVEKYRLTAPLWKSTCHVTFNGTLEKDVHFHLKDQTPIGLVEPEDKGAPVILDCPKNEQGYFIPNDGCTGTNVIPYVSTKGEDPAQNDGGNDETPNNGGNGQPQDDGEE